MVPVRAMVRTVSWNSTCDIRFMKCFLAGSHMVRWDLDVVDGAYPFRLSIHHEHGSIIEYFPTVQAALVRELDRERLLIAARGFEPPAAHSMASSPRLMSASN